MKIKQNIQNCSIALSAINGRISDIDYARLSALLSLPGLSDMSIRPRRDNIAIAFPPPYGERAVPQVCKFISNWRTQDQIIIQARCQRQHDK